MPKASHRIGAWRRPAEVTTGGGLPMLARTATDALRRLAEHVRQGQRVRRCHDGIMVEPPGGTVGCDVCGVLLDAAKTAAHDAWHRAEEERFDRLARAVRELIDLMRERRT